MMYRNPIEQIEHVLAKPEPIPERENFGLYMRNYFENKPIIPNGDIPKDYK
jgi:hypothetical protein